MNEVIVVFVHIPFFRSLHFIPLMLRKVKIIHIASFMTNARVTLIFLWKVKTNVLFLEFSKKGGF